jgi:hypothetical protein
MPIGFSTCWLVILNDGFALFKQQIELHLYFKINTPSVPFYKEQFGKNTQTKESYFFIKNSKIL